MQLQQLRQPTVMDAGFVWTCCPSQHNTLRPDRKYRIDAAYCYGESDVILFHIYRLSFAAVL